MDAQRSLHNPRHRVRLTRVPPVHLDPEDSHSALLTHHKVLAKPNPYGVDLLKYQQTASYGDPKPIPPPPMLRTFCTNGVASASLSLSSAKPLITLTDPLTPRACNIIRNTLQSSFLSSENVYNQSGPNAAVLIPLCNVNGQSGILLQVRGKLRTHPGEIRCVHDSPRSLFPSPENRHNEPVFLVVESMR